MRAVVLRFLVASVGFLVASLPAFGQSPTQPTLARVKGVASVRSAPGDLSPETGKLEPGSYVTVVSAEGNDWLAIQPPPGSISWISWALVEPQAKPGPDGKLPPLFNAIVRADQGAPAVLRAGAVGEEKPLGVQRTKLPEGAIVQVIGSRVKVRADGDDVDASWYKIIAPADDYRYIRRDAVEWTGTPVSTGYVVKTGGSEKPLPGVVPPPPSGSGTGDWTLSVSGSTEARGNRDDFPNYHPVFREAEKARGNGDTKGAERLYRQVADEVSKDGPNKDTKLANLCYDRIYLMQSGNGGGGGSDAGWRPPTTTTTPTPAPTPRAEVPKDEKRAKYADGTLKATRFQISGRPVFVLADGKGLVRYYVVSGGVDLDKYTGRWIEVSGDETKPESLRGDSLIVVTQITAAK